MLVPLPELTEKIIIVQLSMPVQTQTTIVTGLYGLDTPSIKSFTLSTLMTFVMIPLYAMAFQLLY
jgi:predicted permease